MQSTKTNVCADVISFLEKKKFMLRAQSRWWSLLLCIIFCAAAVDVATIKEGEERESEPSQEYVEQSADDVQVLPPLEEEHNYFASLDLDKGPCQAATCP